ncbi:glycoside hydrolase family 32 protein [Bacillaceae bacterium Marseille-Q3522]|nr:glycoside hydrolase family 32 protein [Bacillaceae bacterium Marseille-Q3522]
MINKQNANDIVVSNAKKLNTRFRLGYHFMPESGWMNDPNGFIFFDGYYHLFFQHHPFDSSKGKMHWGHARSRDLLHWEYLKIALYPDQDYDKDGCYSGSAISINNKLYLIYTGHRLNENAKNKKDFKENQNIAVSKDGINFHKISKNPIIKNPPKDCGNNFRDPKVWKFNEVFFMVIGTDSIDKKGKCVLYQSTNLYEWTYVGVLAGPEDALGYMWECPDFFKINNTDVLLFSPQGVTSQGDLYVNEFQTGYFLGQMDYQTMKYVHSDFFELDFGHDFYAPQTTLSSTGKRVLIAWMNMWHSEMPEQSDGWYGAMTIPRELYVNNNKLCMKPIENFTDMRLDHIFSKKNFTLTNNYLSINYPGVKPHLEVDLTISKRSSGTFGLSITDDVTSITAFYDYTKKKFVVNRLGDIRQRELLFENKLQILFFVDTSSIEVFLNNGEQTYTSRYYCNNKPNITIFDTSNAIVSMDIYSLKSPFSRNQTKRGR